MNAFLARLTVGPAPPDFAVLLGTFFAATWLGPSAACRQHPTHLSHHRHCSSLVLPGNIASSKRTDTVTVSLVTLASAGGCPSDC